MLYQYVLLLEPYINMCFSKTVYQYAISIAQSSMGCQVNPSFGNIMETDHEIISAVILILRLIQKGQLSVPDESKRTITGSTA